MNIVEKYGKVKIDGFEFSGDIEQDKFCSICKFNLVYFDEFDARSCPKCNTWIEAKCSDPDCMYCPNRPETPLPHKKA